MERSTEEITIEDYQMPEVIEVRQTGLPLFLKEVKALFAICRHSETIDYNICGNCGERV